MSNSLYLLYRYALLTYCLIQIYLLLTTIIAKVHKVKPIWKKMKNLGKVTVEQWIGVNPAITVDAAPCSCADVCLPTRPLYDTTISP